MAYISIFLTKKEIELPVEIMAGILDNEFTKDLIEFKLLILASGCEEPLSPIQND